MRMLGRMRQRSWKKVGKTSEVNGMEGSGGRFGCLWTVGWKVVDGGLEGSGKMSWKY
jgi:hypothetical protein